MKHLGWILTALSVIVIQQPGNAEGLTERMGSLLRFGELAVGMSESIALSGEKKSDSIRADDPVLGKARFPARAHPTYTQDGWPPGMVEGYFARDKTGCVFFYPKTEDRLFAFSIDKVEEKIDGNWVSMDIKKLYNEVPRHCTGGGG